MDRSLDEIIKAKKGSRGGRRRGEGRRRSFGGGGGRGSRGSWRSGVTSGNLKRVGKYMFKYMLEFESASSTWKKPKV